MRLVARHWADFRYFGDVHVAGDRHTANHAEQLAMVALLSIGTRAFCASGLYSSDGWPAARNLSNTASGVLTVPHAS